MEVRRTVHYKGNSLNAPNPTQKRLKKQITGNFGTIQPGDPILPSYEPKVCATKECIWCAARQPFFAIRCRNCGNCQYCGLLIDNNYGCRFCGNQLDEHLKQVYAEITLRAAESRSASPNNENPGITHVGPKTRSRGPVHSAS